jgi:hypothetical protein
MEGTQHGLYDLLLRTGRPLYGGTDWWDSLGALARSLVEKRTPEQSLEEIFLGGWHLDEEAHGGYESSGGHRESLGRGYLLHRSLHGTVQNERRDRTTSTIIEAWSLGNRSVVFLAIREERETGYVGIDNHHGTDTTWTVVNLRVVPV